MQRFAGSPFTRTLLAGGITTALLAGPGSAQVVDTRGGATVGTGAGLVFGRGDPSVIGQTFTAPTVAPGATLLLQDFAFHFYKSRVPPFFQDRYYEPATFYAAVQAFDGTSVVGDVLFTSAMQTGPTESTSTAVPYVFDVGGLMLTPGTQYLAYFVDDGQPGTSHTVLATHGGSDYADGRPLVGTSVGSLRTLVPPAQLGPFTDIPFVANFSTQFVTPEPATVALVGGGLLALGGVAARRRASPARR